MAMSNTPCLLFTAFEPSGDALAAPMIERLLQLAPQLEIWAFGGPKMRAAGARLLETTTDQAAMLLKAGSQILRHRRYQKQLIHWLADRDLAALVPVDSPAANWSICKLVRGTQPNAKILHLAAPQLWAWAPWRIGKLRRLTDRVLCLLPFEPRWFGQRGVDAVFVGHPLFDSLPRLDGLVQDPPRFTQKGSPKVALLPGSRRAEVHANWPTMLRAFLALKERHPAMQGLVAAGNAQSRQWVHEITNHILGQDHWPDGLKIQTDRTDEVLEWAEAVMVVSGTATLQVAAHRKPMVVLYNVSRMSWYLFGRWVISTRVFSLPNLIAQDRGLGLPVPEFVPHFAAAKPIADALDQLLRDPAARDQQQRTFEQIAGLFENQSFKEAAAMQLLDTLGLHREASNR